MNNKVKYKLTLILLGILVILFIMISQLIPKKETVPKLEEPEKPLANAELFILGTSASIEGLEENQVYTDQGLFLNQTGEDLEQYRMQNIQVVLKDGVIEAVCGTLEKETTLVNVWITGPTENGFRIFVDGYYINFEGDKPTQDVNGVLGDVVVAYEKVTQLRIKQDTISGRILSVQLDGVEIEGYGLVPFSDQFRLYQIYGQLAQKELVNLVVGYDITEFVVAEGKLCAGLVNKPLTMDHIRVLIKTNDYADIFHSQIQLSGNNGFTIQYGQNTEEHAALESVTIAADSPYWEENRILLTPADGGTLTLESITRNQGNPSYAGTLEIRREDGGLVIVNDIPLEEYLYGVLPSEMPSSYGLEALKAQAVCARSYAYNQILNSGYPQYGAHADDSVKFQVYNNLPQTPEVVQAVDETRGIVAAYEDTVITAYYFSTSCGHTTDGCIWNPESNDSTPYLQGKFSGDEQPEQDLTQEDAFRAFIENTDYASYDSQESWYRWKVRIPAAGLTENMKAFGNIGAVKSMAITKRGAGGVAAELSVQGTEGNIVITKEYDIRGALSPKGCTVTRMDGSEVEGSSLLPSGYIILSPVMEQDQLTAYDITGGGYGHGAGMSQNGAKFMASQGKSYQDILQFYYSGINFKQLY